MNDPSHNRLMEVANLLPTDAAKIMMQGDRPSQLYVLGAIALVLDYWEENGVTLDPVQFDLVVTSFVTALMPTVKALGASLQLLRNG